jgi:hypothetical protein
MRYIILVLLNLPIIFLALLNIVTQHKLKKISDRRYHYQLLLWIVLLVVLIASFPIYNILTDNPVLDSKELSLFDIVQTTAIIYMIYIINRQRQKNDLNEKHVRDLHQELSIQLSTEKSASEK